MVVNLMIILFHLKLDRFYGIGVMDQKKVILIKKKMRLFFVSIKHELLLV